MPVNNKDLNDDRLFSRKKTLLTPQQYASSQGISSGVVEECAKLGVVQIRRHKNKTFIVDLPLDAAKTAKQEQENKIEQINTIQQAHRLSGMVNKILQPAIEQNKPIAFAKQTVVPQTAAPIPDLKIFAAEETKSAAIKSENFAPVPVEFKVSAGRKIQDALKLGTRSKIVLAFLAFGLIITASAMVWLGIQHNAQQQKLERAYENIGKLVNEYDAATRKSKMLELENLNWKTEAQQNQKSIAGLQIELVQTKEKLSETQENLSQIQQYHVNTLKQINKQLKEITAEPQKTEQK